MKLTATLLCLVTACDAFQHLRPAVKPIVLHGKTRGDGSEPAAEDDGPLDIDAAIDEALKSPSIVDAISEDINAALGKDDAKTPEEMKIGELTAELDLRGRIDYSDCIEADELRAKLKDARSLLPGHHGQETHPRTISTRRPPKPCSTRRRTP